MLVSLLSSSSLWCSFASKVFVPCKFAMIFHPECFVTIHLVGWCPSMSKMPSLVGGPFIVLFVYKSNCCLISRLFPQISWCVDESWIGGWRWFMETATMSFEPTSISSIRGVECHRYWLISAWSKCESCSINSKGFTSLKLK